MYATLIDCRSLKASLGREDWVVVDTRFDLADKTAGYRAYLEGHIPGAVYADLEKDLSGPVGAATGRHPVPDAAQLTEVFSRLGIGPDTQVVAYDDAGGSIAARLWWLLRYLGHDAAAVLDGGWGEWLGQGLAAESGQPPGRPAAAFQGRPRHAWLVTAATVPAAARLIDSREPARYSGEREPIDPVAGHIPGAVNYFWKRNLDENGRFRPAEEIRRDLLAVLAGAPVEEAVFYCGSGVTACHNLLAAARAGLPAPRLYGGSWSEWCRDPRRPVAVSASP